VASGSVAVVFTILVSASLLYTNGIVSPALATIGQAFPGKGADTVQLIYSIPKMMLFVFALLSGYVASRLSIKKCMLLGCVFQALGTLPAWIGGFGFFNPGMALLVADRSRMPDEVPRMLSLHLALNGFGQFFTVYVLKGLRTVLGYGSIGYDWLGAGVLILALCFAYVLLDHRLSPED
jgi:MFS family permease